MTGSRTLVIAQISDMHVRPEGTLAYRRLETGGFLDRCVEQLARMTPRPDLVLATGDLVDGGGAEEYRRLRALLAPLPVPVYVVPGNHDDREALAAAFSDHAYLPSRGTFLHYVVDDYPVRLVGLDTVVPGEAGGHLCEERLAWLDARLGEAPVRPTVLFMHHPPFRTGIVHMDRMGLRNAEGFGEVLARHPQVERVLCGHLHRSIQVRWRGTLVSTAPGTAHQVVLDLREDAPATFAMEPPAFVVHLWREDLGLVTHTCHVGEFPGPYPFH